MSDDLPENILWYIETLKKDRRKLTPELRLKLSADMINSIVRMKNNKRKRR